MEKLQLPHAKLLYFVSELWKQQEITDSEKLTLKGIYLFSSFPIINPDRVNPPVKKEESGQEYLIIVEDR